MRLTKTLAALCRTSTKSFVQLAACALIGATLLSAGAAFAGTESYTYDALGRLISVLYSNGTYVHYAYDAAGNRISVVTVPQSSSGVWGAFNWGAGVW